MTAARPGFTLVDDAHARVLEPLASTRPAGEIRAGALLIRERWERALRRRCTGFIGAPALRQFSEAGAPAAASTVPRGTIIVNARFAPRVDTGLTLDRPGDAAVADGRIVAVRLAKDTTRARLPIDDLGRLAGGGISDAAGWWIDETWDLVRHLPDMLAHDAQVLADAIPDDPPTHSVVLGKHRLAVAPGAYLEPYVVADTTNGDVVILEDARIGAFTRLAGPCVIGRGATVAAGRITACAIGDHSRACGEMSVSIMAGYSNKGHDGFVGHSVIGRWANLGAGTTTSNLKNSYGPVRVEDSRGSHETGMQFLGSLIGDHVKTAIGTRLMTGTIVGAGANVFGDRSPPKWVRPFSWGDAADAERVDIARFLVTAERVMARRNVDLSRGMRAVLTAAWEASATTPRGRGRR